MICWQCDVRLLKIPRGSEGGWFEVDKSEIVRLPARDSHIGDCSTALPS